MNDIRQVKIDSNDLLNNFTNKEYLKLHMNDYAKFLAKEFHINTRFYKNPILVLERYDIFYLIMNMIKNGDIRNLYKSSNPMMNLELIKQLGILEDQMFQV